MTAKTDQMRRALKNEALVLRGECRNSEAAMITQFEAQASDETLKRLYAKFIAATGQNG